MDKITLAKYLDLANHHQEATVKDIEGLCQEVLTFGFNGAFVNPAHISLVKEKLGGKAKAGTVVSFPLGQETLEIKVASAIEAVKLGADELDVSLNVAYLLEGEWGKSEEEMKRIVDEVKSRRQDAVVKFIIETGCLSPEKIQEASKLILTSGADFIKTSSGMGPRGASLKDVELIKEAVGEKIKIKVAGGIDTLEEALAFIEKGVSRIGTSHAVKIIEEISAQ